MTEDLEARLRAHFAHRTAAEPIGDDVVPLDELAARRGRRTPRHLAVAAAAVVVVAAVVALLVAPGDDPDDLDLVDDPTSTTTPTSSTSTTTGRTTSTAPPAEAPEAAVPTTEAPRRVQSIVVGPHGHLARWDGTRWRTDDLGYDAVRPGDRYDFVGLGRVVASEAAPETITGCFGDVEHPLVPFEHWREPNDGVEVAVHGVEDVAPRPVVGLDVDRSGHRAAAVELLASLGIDDPEPPVVVAHQVDLEGDGTNEVLLEIRRITDQTDGPALDDYSVVALRRVVDGQVVTQVLHEDVADTPDGPGFPFAYLAWGRVTSIGDLNGDGDMEVVVLLQEYEGAGHGLYEVGPDGLQLVAGVGCGA